mgnify:CR=1 FL=1
MSVCCQTVLFSYRGISCKGSASCRGPKTAFDHLCAGSHGQPPRLEHTFRSSYTPRTEDALLDMLCLPSANGSRSRACLLIVCAQDAAAYARRSISVRIPRAFHSPDACTVFSVCTAFLFLQIKKDAPLGTPCLYVTLNSCHNHSLHKQLLLQLSALLFHQHDKT